MLPVQHACMHCNTNQGKQHSSSTSHEYPAPRSSPAAIQGWQAGSSPPARQRGQARTLQPCRGADNKEAGRSLAATQQARSESVRVRPCGNHRPTAVTDAF
eukprot:GHVU01202101.1.p1 GENE.GHVU01202101.1~~GHVU01202101.1.p1  ORF type:complete len:101 (-),score=14.88 GHVU01202101.1:72-374(-)